VRRGSCMHSHNCLFLPVAFFSCIQYAYALTLLCVYMLYERDTTHWRGSVITRLMQVRTIVLLYPPHPPQFSIFRCVLTLQYLPLPPPPFLLFPGLSAYESHVTHMNTSCHTWKLFLSRVWTQVIYYISLSHVTSFLDGYCSTVQGLLDWFEVDLGFTKLLFIQIDLCVMCVFVTRMNTGHWLYLIKPCHHREYAMFSIMLLTQSPHVNESYHTCKSSLKHNHPVSRVYVRLWACTCESELSCYMYSRYE